MDTLTATDLQVLISSEGPLCVSLFMPTNVAGNDAEQDSVRVKNLLNTAEKELVDRGCRAPEARDSLGEVRRLVNDELFWRQRSEGLAVFTSPMLTRAYRLRRRFDESITVGDRFVIKPLLPLLATSNEFGILALSQNKVRLFRATEHDCEALDVPNLPGNLAEALDLQPPQRVAQYHSAKLEKGKEGSAFHGQGTSHDTSKEEIEQYCRRVDDAVCRYLASRRWPLVLAGVEYVLAIYRSTSKYANIASEAVFGNPDQLSPHEIQRRALPVVAPMLKEPCQSAVAQCHRLLGSQRASDDLRTIVPAAVEGKVETLLLGDVAEQWGRLDTETGEIVLHDAKQSYDQELLDFAAVETLLHRGAVLTLALDDMPSDQAACAVFRY